LQLAILSAPLRVIWPRCAGNVSSQHFFKPCVQLMFVKAQTTPFFIDIIKAPWFIHYSYFFHCYLKFCEVVINNEVVQFLSSSRIKILHFVGCNHGITMQKKTLYPSMNSHFFFLHKWIWNIVFITVCEHTHSQYL